MRRRSDDWINATHILKVAGFDKPARTRILEREVQKGVHEKVQGGYGKYQGKKVIVFRLSTATYFCRVGTWVPLPDGRELAERNKCLDRLQKIFDYVPGDRSPPPAPKHTTAASNKPKAPKATAQPRKAQQQGSKANNYRTRTPVSHAAVYHPTQRMVEDQYDNISAQFNDDESPEHTTLETSSMMDEDDMMQMSQNSTGNRKRKRGVYDNMMSTMEQEHMLYGDELLDYFMTRSDDISGIPIYPPVPPPNFQINKPIEDSGGTALHWAAAMGDVEVAKDLLRRSANPAAQTQNAETPLIRAVLFMNNFEKESFADLVNLLQSTIHERDWAGATVLHHACETTRTKNKWRAARYYCEVLVNKLSENPRALASMLLSQDADGNTPVLCAARTGCFRLALFLLTHCPEAGDAENKDRLTANEIIKQHTRHQKLEQPASSPVQAIADHDGSIVHHRATNGYGNNTHRKSSGNKASSTQRVFSSRAANAIIQKVPSINDAISSFAEKLDLEATEKDIAIAEARKIHKQVEAERQAVRQQVYANLAKAEHQDEGMLKVRRAEYEKGVREVESLLEQCQHAEVQGRVHIEDSQLDPRLFHINGASAAVMGPEDQMQRILWARKLWQEQERRRSLVREVARLMGDAGTGERIGLHRRLVSMAVGIGEEELDGMSGELLEALEPEGGGKVRGFVDGNPRTPTRKA